MRLWRKISPLSAYDAGGDRNLRRPAQQAGGRHAHGFRPRTDDLERLHGRGRLDAPPGLEGVIGARLVDNHGFCRPTWKSRAVDLRSSRQFPDGGWKRACCRKPTGESVQGVGIRVSKRNVQYFEMLSKNPAGHPDSAQQPVIVLQRPMPCATECAVRGSAAGEVRARMAGDARFAFPRIADGHVLACGRCWPTPCNTSAGPGHHRRRRGYPVEGWNHDPGKGLFLRSFTQLTAIGAVGRSAGRRSRPGRPTTVHLATRGPRWTARWSSTACGTTSRIPAVGARACWATSSDLAADGASWAAVRDRRQRIRRRFRAGKGRRPSGRPWRKRAGSFRALAGQDADIRRGAAYGSQPLRRPLAPFADDADQEPAHGALGPASSWWPSATTPICPCRSPRRSGRCWGRHPGGDPRARGPFAAKLRKWNIFSKTSGRATSSSTTARSGMFRFGWDASARHVLRLGGLPTAIGRSATWTTWSTSFAGRPRSSCSATACPTTALANLGFKIKPYRLAGRPDAVYIAGPLGRLGVPGARPQPLDVETCTIPSWKRSCENLVDVEIDYCSAATICPASSPNPTPAATPVYTGASAFPRSPSTRAADHRRPLALHAGRRLSRSRRTGSNSYWTPTGASSRSCSRTTGRGKVTTRPSGRSSVSRPPCTCCLSSWAPRYRVGQHGQVSGFKRLERAAQRALQDRPQGRFSRLRYQERSPGRPTRAVVRLTRDADGLHLQGENVSQSGIDVCTAGSGRREPLRRPADNSVQVPAGNRKSNDHAEQEGRLT